MTQHTYSYNNRHLMRDGRPWLPSMGEIHYSRCRPEDWRQSIRLMKAGGVDIAASYIFWNHHEAEEGVFDFTGCRDLGRFLDLCDEEDMPVWLRIGPWCHGEARHGGFPDWLLASGCAVRSDDPAYLACAASGRRCTSRSSGISVGASSVSSMRMKWSGPLANTC